jgi:light-regulated signal transduction histidine kinase (bacteriophytochrome)
LILDEDLRVVRVNEAACLVLARAEEELVGRRVHEAIPRWPHTLSASSSDPEPTRFVTGAGTMIEVRSGAWRGGDLGCSVVTVTPVTELAMKTAAAIHDWEDLLDITVHDLREPLRKILAFSGHLEEDAGESLSTRAREDLGYITDGARRLASLVADLAEYSRIVRMEFDPARVSLDECVDEALRVHAEAISNTGASIDRSPLPSVEGQADLIATVFEHLIGNALKFARERPRIEIRALSTPQGPILEVCDRGIGIAPAHHQAVFQPFKRLEGRRFDGSGIGLALCAQAVARHGGKIWVESELGEGSSFRFTLDATIAEACREQNGPPEVGVSGR